MPANGGLGGFGGETPPLTVTDSPRREPRWRWAPRVLGMVVIFLSGLLIGLYIPRGEGNSVGLGTVTTLRSTSSTEPFFSTTVADATASTVAGASATTTRRAATTTLRRSPSPTTAVRAPATTTTTRPPSERVVGRTSGGGNGAGTSSVSFSVTGAWRIDHAVQGGEASISVFDQAGGYSFGYTAQGTGSRTFNRTCTCRVVVSNPEGTYTITVVDVVG